MRRTDRELFCSIFPVLLAATIFFACDDGNRSGSSAGLIGESVFGYTGGPQQFVVPDGVTSIAVNAFGGRGGDGWNADTEGRGGFGGLGGNVQATLSVTPGETLYLYVGGAGADGDPTDRILPEPGSGGWNGGGYGRVHDSGSRGGGGGGASDIRRGGEELTDRILVAGGGGSGSGWCSWGGGNGGPGGGTVGGNGQTCDVSEDLDLQCDALPSLGVAGEVGLRAPFSSNERIVAGSLTTTTTSSCGATDQPGVDNVSIRITNRSGQDFLAVYYVANRETTITNFDGLINGEEAFKIDSVGANTPLISESITPDNIFEANEAWVFILQDFENTLGVAATRFASIGIPSDVDGYSSGSIIGIVAGNGGTDTAGGWAGGDFGEGGTQELVDFNSQPNRPFSERASGAGGGGWYGGGVTDGSGGGGGSSYVTPIGSSGISQEQGVRNGHGLIVIGTN